MEVLDMSEDDAKTWFNDKTTTEISIAQLVEDMKAYVDTKPANFRLLFMIDEVGQYVGTDTDMLLNLQSLTEKIGSECEGKIWVICTGQEAIDEIIKVRADEFSRIQARFKTRLSLSSSSVDEVIQKRILKKKPEATTDLETVYEQNDSVLRNLFSFSGSILDIKGYSGPREFTENFPFVPYQSSSCRRYLRKSGNMEIPVSTCLVVSVPCCPASRKLHRKFRRRMNTHLFRSSVFMIPYILSWTALSAG